MSNDLNHYDDQLLLDYIEGELSPEKRAQVDQMMRADNQLALMVRQLIHDRNELRELYEPTPPGWVMEEVEQALERSMLFGGSRVDGARFSKQNRQAQGMVVLVGTLAAVLAVVGSVMVSLVMSTKEKPDVAGNPVNPPSVEQGTSRTPQVTPPVVVAVTPDPVKDPTVKDPKDPPVVVAVTPDQVKDPIVKDPKDPPVVVVAPKDPVAPPLDTHGQVDPIAARNLIRLAPQQMQNPQFIEDLVALLARSPERASEVELHLLGQEPVKAYRRLAEFSEKKPESEPTMAPIRLRLVWTPHQLAQQLMLLRSDPNLKLQWFLSAKGQEALGKPAPLKLDPWPAIRPDYQQILDQLLEEASASPGALIRLPVVIDHAGLSVTPTTAPEQDPTLQVIDRLIRQIDEAQKSKKP